MRFILEMSLGSDSFQEPSRDLEIATILRRVATSVELYSPDGVIFDSNGNHIGAHAVVSEYYLED